MRQFKTGASKLFTMLLFCCQVVFYPTLITAQESKDRFDIEFEDKISFYLNQQTRAFYKDMLVKEKLLLQMIYNVNEEFKRRGLKLATDEQIPADVFFDYSDRLIAEYNREIDLLQQTIDKTGQLEQVSGSEESLKALVRLQRQLEQILEDRGMFKPASYPRGILVKLIKDYNRELDTVLHLYDVFEDLVHKVKNDSLLQQLKQQKDLIAQVLDFYSRPVEQDSIVTQYTEEVKRLNKVLNQIELLKFRTSGSHMQVFYALEELRHRILSQLDENLVALLSEPEPQPRRISVFEIFNEWKTKEIAAHSASLTKYQIIKVALLQTATPAEKDRMLENDLKNAFISHADEDFEVAEKQFTQILLEYPGYERRFASLYFYRAESFFARNLLIKAGEDYQVVLESFSNSEYETETLFKLMVIAERSNDSAAFYKNYDRLSSQIAHADPSLRDRFYFLAGYYHLREAKYRNAAQLLNKVESHSYFYLSARFLLGVSLTNLNENDAATRIFTGLTQNKNYPWTNIYKSYFRNKALLQLGLLNYEKGDYKRAIVFLQQVSPGFVDYDKSLIGIAWAHLKLGDLERTIVSIDFLISQSFSSETTYEALVLAAFVNQELGREDVALQNFRYVTNAYRVFDVAGKYNEEKKQILRQLNQLDQLEQDAIASNNSTVYRGIAESRARLLNTLEKFQYHGDAWNPAVDEIAVERSKVMQQIEELDEFIVLAYTDSRKDLAERANGQRERLMTALNKYKSDLTIRNRNYFADYPLTTREVVQNYRKEILQNLLNEINVERQKLTQTKSGVEALQQTLAQRAGNTSLNLKMNLIAEDLNRLDNKSEQFQAWLNENQLTELETDFTRWADISVSGVSDLTYDKIQTNETQVVALADKIQFVTAVIEKRRNVLEQKLNDYDRIIRQIEYEIQSHKLDDAKDQKDLYFREKYFDEKEAETEVKIDNETIE